VLKSLLEAVSTSGYDTPTERMCLGVDAATAPGTTASSIEALRLCTIAGRLCLLVCVIYSYSSHFYCTNVRLSRFIKGYLTWLLDLIGCAIVEPQRASLHC